jgi:hypothetical protein
MPSERRRIALSCLATSDDPGRESIGMKNRERRELLLIEKNLLAESPELAAMFAPLARRTRVRRAAPWFAACLLALAAFLDDTTILIGSLALLCMSIVRWTVWPTDTEQRP